MKRNNIFASAEILLPRDGVDYSKWSVIACDQFTSSPKYWNDLKEYVGDEPSALNLVLPEIYLSESETRAKKLSEKMQEYLDSNLFKVCNGYILVKRNTIYNNLRKGIVCAVDLSAYDYRKGSKALIRATEGTVLERLPPRIKIRQMCKMELPHIMLLIDDEKNSVMQAAESCKRKLVYDFTLNSNGGQLKGELIEQGKRLEQALEALLFASAQKYGEPLLMAVGDGNHSLAAAKDCYDMALKANADNAELLRYALVEVVNIYDEGLKFEPIHRVVFGVDGKDFIAKLLEKTKVFTQESSVYCGGEEVKFNLPSGAIEGVSFIQGFIDDYILTQKRGKIDYIHGLESIKELGADPSAVGIELKAMNKSELFEYIIKKGVLPKKTFSMGEAEEKRYYTEARMLVKK